MYRVLHNQSLIEDLFCPYCGAKAEFVSAEVVYGNNFKNLKLYVCSNYPDCDSYVGVHEGTRKPKGSLANWKLREARKTAHAAFDTLWRRGKMTRTKAYRKLAAEMKIQSRDAHIGMFNEQQCEQVLEIVKLFSSSNAS